MRFLHRDKAKYQRADEGTSIKVAGASADQQRRQAQAKMVLYCLNDRMRVFQPMTMRVMRQIENEHGLDVLYPKNVTYGGGDPYFPTYEWQILPKQNVPDTLHDPRKLTLALRASPGSNISEILVYYLLSYTDAHGDEHPIHRLPTDFRNETMIQALLLDGIRSAGLTNASDDPSNTPPRS